MANLLYRTKQNASPKGKPRVYFTCHPEDFEKCFDKICEDILKTHDCAIFYTEDMQSAMDEQEKSLDLESNNLFVVPVTLKLLSQPNRAMDEDIPFALEKGIPVLPFMMDSGIDTLYSRIDKFGALQYLNPVSRDVTEVPYAEKLKKYLDSVLVSDELAARVQAAFDAYIFLSYRKKDRRHANEVIRLIHADPVCQHIAVWYDEFLIPGEDFRENIQQALQNSRLFLLLVTPNILEELGGKPNFVMEEEYPDARKAGMEILALEAEDTDRLMLRRKFPGIPEPLEVSSPEEFLQIIQKIAKQSDQADPARDYLIGIAYLEGINMEVDRPRALELIRTAAEEKLPEAMGKLFWMYKNGDGVRADYEKAAQWAKRLMGYYEERDGKESAMVVHWAYYLSFAYSDMGAYRQAMEWMEYCYNAYSRVLGETHATTMHVMNNLAHAYSKVGDYEKQLELAEKLYAIRSSVAEEGDPEAIGSIINLATTYNIIGKPMKALGLCQEGYRLAVQHLGEASEYAMAALSTMASVTNAMGNYKDAVALSERLYDLRCEHLGEDHLDSVTTLANLSGYHEKLGNYEKALKMNQDAYYRLYKTFGEKHPMSLQVQVNQGIIWEKMGHIDRAARMYEVAYENFRELLGEDHPDTIAAWASVASAYGRQGELRKALEIGKKVYAKRCRLLGEDHPTTLASLNELAGMYSHLRDYENALPLVEKAYESYCRILGEDHPGAQDTLINLIATNYNRAIAYTQNSMCREAMELLQKTQLLLEKNRDKEHPLNGLVPDFLGSIYRREGRCQYCGGAFMGLLKKKCSLCKRKKDY